MVMCLAVNRDTHPPSPLLCLLHIFHPNNQTKLGAFQAPSAMRRSWRGHSSLSTLFHPSQNSLLGNVS